MKGIEKLEQLATRYDILDTEAWVDLAVEELKPEGANASRALAKLIQELLACRNPKLLDVFMAVEHLEPTPELIKAVRSVAKAPGEAPQPTFGRFDSEISGGGKVGWTEQTAQRIKHNANLELERLQAGEKKRKWWQFWRVASIESKQIGEKRRFRVDRTNPYGQVKKVWSQFDEIRDDASLRENAIQWHRDFVAAMPKLKFGSDEERGHTWAMLGTLIFYFLNPQKSIIAGQCPEAAHCYEQCLKYTPNRDDIQRPLEQVR